MPVISGLYRYPIKGLSAQLVSSTVPAAGQPFPHDRIFALARQGSAADTDEPRWAKKGLFVMLMLEESLARVQTRLDVDTLDLTIRRENEALLSVNLEEDRGRRMAEEFITASCRRSALRHGWCAPAMAISWTSRTASSRS